ncbi:MAG TPA: suppressor of fused domain protein [Longimicrobium sp.]|nr:suppressor of fused domain protein [Longimicrobium sp.]
MISERVRAHYERLWGPPARQAFFRKGPHAVHVFKWDRDAHPDEVYFYATAGASDHPLPGLDAAHRMEVYVGFTAAVDGVAETLADIALHPVLHGTALGHGHGIAYPAPLWPGTAMDTALLVLPPADEEIVPRLDAGPEAHVEFLQVMPLFPSEAAYRRLHGTAGLLARWDEDRVPYWNPHRPPPAFAP